MPLEFSEEASQRWSWCIILLIVSISRWSTVVVEGWVRNKWCLNRDPLLYRDITWHHWYHWQVEWIHLWRNGSASPPTSTWAECTKPSVMGRGWALLWVWQKPRKNIYCLKQPWLQSQHVFTVKLFIHWRCYSTAAIYCLWLSPVSLSRPEKNDLKNTSPSPTNCCSTFKVSRITFSFHSDAWFVLQ